MEIYFLIVVCGVFAGFIGSLAGLGSAIGLYALIDIVGMDATIANGTNRLGILAMSVMALPTFYKKGHLNLQKSKFVILALFLGAIGGFYLAIYTDGQNIKNAFKYLLPVLLFIILFKPQKWTQGTDFSYNMNIWLSMPFFLMLGFYAGFIQVGTGVALVIFLSIFGRYSLVDATGVKLSAFALYTIVGLVIFTINEKIDWGYGILLASGQGLGGYIAARVATSYPHANSFVRYLLIIVLIIAIIRMFKFYELLY